MAIYVTDGDGVERKAGLIEHLFLAPLMLLLDHGVARPLMRAADEMEEDNPEGRS